MCELRVGGSSETSTGLLSIYKNTRGWYVLCHERDISFMVSVLVSVCICQWRNKHWRERKSRKHLLSVQFILYRI